MSLTSDFLRLFEKEDAQYPHRIPEMEAAGGQTDAR